MHFWPAFKSQRLGEVAPGSVIFFRYQDVNYYALVVDPERQNESPDLVVFHPKHPMVENAGLLKGSVIGGLGQVVQVLEDARATVENPYTDLEGGSGYVAAGSLIVMNGETAIVCYVDNRSKGAFSIRTGAHLGEAWANEYYKTWSLEAKDGESFKRLAKITARPRG